VITGERLAEWLSRLVRIPSVNPAQAGPKAGVPGEAALAAAVREWFQEFGGEVDGEEVYPGRPNVYGIWRGRSDRWMAVDVHLDTVGVEQMEGDPFSGEIRAGRVYGRGAVDTKPTLAVVLALLESLRQTGRTPAANLLIAATVDEEVNARGAPASAAWIRQRQLPIDQLVIAEPTLCSPVYGHKGIFRLEFRIEGLSTHSSQPHLGKNAITAAARLALALEAEGEHLQSLSPQSPLGNPTLTVARIQGGRGLNVVPDSCTLAFDRRVVPGEKADEIQAGLLELARHHCPLPFTIGSVRYKDPFFQSPNTPWMRQLAAWSGREPAIVPFCTNAPSYRGIAQEYVVIGPGSISQAHGAEEWVEIAELEKIAAVYARWWGLLPEA